MEITSPLAWPAGQPRRPFRSTRLFRFNRERPLDEAVAGCERAARKIGGSNLVLTCDRSAMHERTVPPNCNGPNPYAASLWLRRSGKALVFPCDSCRRLPGNVWAIAKHIEAMAGQERWGVGTVDQQSTGYLALPAGTPLDLEAADGVRVVGCYSVLGVSETATAEEIGAAFRSLAKDLHPDAGGDTGLMRRLIEARKQALARLETRS